MNRSLVSSIIIFLNAEKFIQEAIESVFAQKYNNWELLLVDDGSTDNSTAIALQYAGKYPEKVRYLEHDNHQNRGMSASRNLGISRAKGEYIAFLDADDVWLPHKLEQQVAILNSHPEAAMVYGRTLIWYSWTGNPENRQLDHFCELGVQPNTLVKPPALFFLLLENKVQTPTTCNAIVRREVFECIGGFEESFRGMYEDQVFFAKVHLKAPVFVANEFWAKYRQHPNNCNSTSTNIGEYHSARLPFMNWLAEYLSEQGFKNTEVWEAFQKELWLCQHPYLHRLLNHPKFIVKRIKDLFIARSTPNSKNY